MLLRRITEHVREQNWTAVGIDFVIVVIGVFVGIQMNGWNEQRGARTAEAAFYQQLHSDILLTEAMQERVADRRTAVGEYLRSATEVVYERTERDTLTNDECYGIIGSSILTIPVADFGSFNELAATGRVSIIRDHTLRSSLLEMQQLGESIQVQIVASSRRATNLANTYPSLIQMTAYRDDTDEVRGNATCNLAAMRSNQAFLNSFFTNVDVYDAFLRDGLTPWRETLRDIHDQTDRLLGIEHAETP